MVGEISFYILTPRFLADIFLSLWSFCCFVMNLFYFDLLLAIYTYIHTGCPRKKVTDLIMASAKDLASMDRK